MWHKALSPLWWWLNRKAFRRVIGFDEGPIDIMLVQRKEG